jgi:hypothetical protein
MLGKAAGTVAKLAFPQVRRLSWSQRAGSESEGRACRLFQKSGERICIGRAEAMSLLHAPQVVLDHYMAIIAALRKCT